MPKLVRITTVPISLKKLITGQMKYMKDHGFEVIMMSAVGSEVKEVVEYEECPHIIIPLTRKITPIQDLRALWILYKQLKEIKPDIVHSHTPKAGLIGMLAAWLARVPVRIHTVAGLPLETTQGLKRILLKNIERITYAAANHVWPNSQSLYNFILSNNLTRKNKLRIIGKGSSNGIKVEEFDASMLDHHILNEVKAKIKYAEVNKYLLFVGRLVKDKGIIELVEAFKNVSQEIDSLKLILVGPLEQDLDPLPEYILDEIENNKDILAVGYSDVVSYYMNLADVFVFPSHREGFPNAPMQAGLMDCPVVASIITGNVDLIEDQEDGLLFEKGNSRDLSLKIKQVLINPTETKHRTERFKKKILSKYRREKMHELILSAYTELLSKQNG